MSTYNPCNRRRRTTGLAAALLVLTLSACAGGQQATRPSDSGGDYAGGPSGSEREGEPSFTAEQLNQRGLLGIKKEDRAKFLDPDSPLSTRTIYFEFDSSRIQSKFNEALRAHANYLSQHPEVTLRLEGHTDERGTREYNVALGERRAESVEKVLVLNGADPEQLTTLSFGEERPAELGSTEAAYAKNRRVELIYVDN